MPSSGASTRHRSRRAHRAVPPHLATWQLELSPDGRNSSTITTGRQTTGALPACSPPSSAGACGFADLSTRQSSPRTSSFRSSEKRHERPRRSRRSISTRWRALAGRCCKAWCRRWSPRRSTSSSSARPYGSRMQEICGVAYAASSRPASSSDADLPVRDERVRAYLFPEIHRSPITGSLLPRRDDGDPDRLCRGATTKAMMIGLIILATAASSSIFRSRIPFLIAVLHAEDRRHLHLAGFIIGIWARTSNS